MPAGVIADVRPSQRTHPRSTYSAHRFVGGAEGADVVRRLDDPFEGFHHAPADPVTLPVGMHADAFDVSRPQGSPLVHDSSLHDRGMADQLVASPGDGMHSSDRVLPVGVGHLSGEDHIQQLAGHGQHGRIELGGVAPPRSRTCRSRSFTTG